MDDQVVDSGCTGVVVVDARQWELWYREYILSRMSHSRCQCSKHGVGTSHHTAFVKYTGSRLPDAGLDPGSRYDRVMDTNTVTVSMDWVKAVVTMATSAGLLSQSATAGGSRADLVKHDSERLVTDIQRYLELSLREPALQPVLPLPES